jgi:hypothetical protein
MARNFVHQELKPQTLSRTSGLIQMIIILIYVLICLNPITQLRYKKEKKQIYVTIENIKLNETVWTEAKNIKATRKRIIARHTLPKKDIHEPTRGNIHQKSMYAR